MTKTDRSERSTVCLADMLVLSAGTSAWNLITCRHKASFLLSRRIMITQVSLTSFFPLCYYHACGLTISNACLDTCTIQFTPKTYKEETEGKGTEPSKVQGHHSGANSYPFCNP
jgi:hypothetical protein